MSKKVNPIRYMWAVNMILSADNVERCDKALCNELCNGRYEVSRYRSMTVSKSKAEKLQCARGVAIGINSIIYRSASLIDNVMFLNNMWDRFAALEIALDVPRYTVQDVVAKRMMTQ